VARLAAYRNVWWSLANENSFIRHLTDTDWDRLFQLVQAKDPYGHLRSIHNAGRIYDYGKPWVTHVSLQYYMAVRFFGVSPLLRDIYRKPIVHDEINYEGTIAKRWGRLTGEEMVYRFWIAVIGGAYATHGETRVQPDGDGWISRGGTLAGASPARIAFLRQIVEDGPDGGLDPIDQYYETNSRPARAVLPDLLRQGADGAVAVCAARCGAAGRHAIPGGDHRHMEYDRCSGGADV